MKKKEIIQEEHLSETVLNSDEMITTLQQTVVNQPEEPVNQPGDTMNSIPELIQPEIQQPIELTHEMFGNHHLVEVNRSTANFKINFDSVRTLDSSNGDIKVQRVVAGKRVLVSPGSVVKFDFGFKTSLKLKANLSNKYNKFFKIEEDNISNGMISIKNISDTSKVIENDTILVYSKAI